MKFSFVDSSRRGNMRNNIYVIVRYYINYKLMKKKVNRYTHQIENGTDKHAVLKDFSRLLDIQVLIMHSDGIPHYGYSYHLIHFY